MSKGGRIGSKYITIFIMMSNMGWVMKEILAWTGRYGLKVKALIFPHFTSTPLLPHNCRLVHADFTTPKPGARGGTLTQGFIHTCKTILAHFHFACNGSMPLSIPWSELGVGGSGSINNGMTHDQIDYLRNIQQEISRCGKPLNLCEDAFLQVAFD
jgi:hypothetical protein